MHSAKATDIGYVGWSVENECARRVREWQRDELGRPHVDMLIVLDCPLEYSFTRPVHMLLLCSQKQRYHVGSGERSSQHALRVRREII